MALAGDAQAPRQAIPDPDLPPLPAPHADSAAIGGEQQQQPTLSKEQSYRLKTAAALLPKDIKWSEANPISDFITHFECAVAATGIDPANQFWLIIPQLPPGDIRNRATKAHMEKKISAREFLEDLRRRARKLPSIQLSPDQYQQPGESPSDYAERIAKTFSDLSEPQHRILATTTIFCGLRDPYRVELARGLQSPACLPEYDELKEKLASPIMQHIHNSSSPSRASKSVGMVAFPPPPSSPPFDVKALQDTLAATVTDAVRAAGRGAGWQSPPPYAAAPHPTYSPCAAHPTQAPTQAPARETGTPWGSGQRGGGRGSRGRGGQKRSPYCSNCKTEGHWTDKCPEPARPPYACLFCGDDHWHIDCPKRLAQATPPPSPPAAAPKGAGPGNA